MDPRNPTDDDDNLVSTLDGIIEQPTAIGGFAPQMGGVGMPEPVPEISLETMACLRGPCQHYMEIQQWHGSGNPAGTPGIVNERTTRFCTVLNGEPLDLCDEAVYECNRWDPSDGDLDEDRQNRRDAWFERFPKFKPTED